MRARADLVGRSLAAREIARADQHDEAVSNEILCDLAADALVGPGDQGDALVVDLVQHGNLHPSFGLPRPTSRRRRRRGSASGSTDRSPRATPLRRRPARA